jgi:murein DD-endopeptidase MepM/ murein hydrolase activator NlpD
MCAGATGAAIGALRSSSEDAASLTERLKQLTREKERVQDVLRGVKRRQRRVTRQLTALDEQLYLTEQRLRQTRLNIRRTRGEVEEADRDYETAAELLDEHREDLSDRLVVLHQQSEVRPVEVLLQSTSFTDFANRLYLLNRVVALDSQLLSEFQDSRDHAESRRVELAQRVADLAALEKRLSDERRRAAAERQVTEEEKKEILRDRAAWERALAELEQSSREIEGMLQRLQQTPDGQARLAKPWAGTVQWPLKGRISSGFGYRKHPIYRVRKMHTGIDIAVPHGTPIKAAAGGTVVHAARWGGYGNCVIVDHGGGLATLYGHCSRLSVKKGQEVRQAQVIAYVGSTGLSTGPHLHFETRRDGRPVDPMKLLP